MKNLVFFLSTFNRLQKSVYHQGVFLEWDILHKQLQVYNYYSDTTM